MREARIAEQARAFVAQRRQSRRSPACCRSSPPLSPRAIQARNAFSRSSRRAENCRNGSTLERLKRHRVLALQAALLGGAARRRAGEIRQAGEIVLAERHHVGLLVGEHVLAERRCRGSRAARRSPSAAASRPRRARRRRGGTARGSAPARAPARPSGRGCRRACAAASSRANSLSFRWISFQWRASSGAMSRSIAWIASLVWAPAST